MKNGARPRTKILMPLYYYSPYTSGVSVCAKRVAEGLVQAGYQVTILTSRYDKNLPKHEVINGVEVLRRPVLFKLNKGIIMPTFWLDIIRLAHRYDYINPNLPMAESGVSSLFVPKYKIISVYHCDLNLGKGLLDKLITWVSMGLMSLQLRRSRAVVPSTIDYLQHSKMKQYLSKSVPIGPMITVNEFKPINSESLYKRIGVSDEEKRIGFVGRVVYEKGIDYLLESIQCLEQKLNKFKIIIVGEHEKVAGGSVKDRLDKYMEIYPGKIIFTGFLSDKELTQFYSGLDVLVLPSIDPLEAYGMVQIEAMLCGTPVVASNLPGVRTIVQRTGYGRISKVKDSKDIAAQIIEVINNPMKYRPSRSKVARLFSPKEVISAYEKLMPKV